MRTDFQDYSWWEIFEKLAKQLFSIWWIDLVLKPYEIYPELQNKWIDWIIEWDKWINLQMNKKSFQIKMFENTFKYRTFPWEVARYLEDEWWYVDEPHEADFHIIFDPAIREENFTTMKMLLFKTKERMAWYYKWLWNKLIEGWHEPPTNWNLDENSAKFWFESWQYWKCIKYKGNEDIYQLKFRNSAYQRNVRCRWTEHLPDRLEFIFKIPPFYINRENIDKLTWEVIKEGQPEIVQDTSIIDYLTKHL